MNRPADEYDAFREIVTGRTIAFNATMARAFGGNDLALFWQQIAWWTREDNAQWVARTQREIEEVTNLSRFQQEQARKKLVALGVLLEERRGVPAQMHYAIDWARARDVITTYAQNARNSQSSLRGRPAREKVADQSARNSQTGSPETDSQVRQEVTGLSVSYPQTFRETGEEEKTEDQSKSISHDPGTEHNAALWLIPFVRDFARELGDEAPFQVSLARVSNIWQASGLGQHAFVELLYEARERTQAKSHAITRERASSGFGPLKNKFPYFCEVLQNLVTESAGPRQNGTG